MFSNGRANYGGNFYLWDSGTAVNLYRTRFTGSKVDSVDGGDGNDIYRSGGGAITIHNTCPSPYASNTPTQGKTRMITRRIASSIEPFIATKLTSYLPNPHLPSFLFSGSALDTCRIVGGSTYSCSDCAVYDQGYYLTVGCHSCQTGQGAPGLSWFCRLRKLCRLRTRKVRVFRHLRRLHWLHLHLLLRRNLLRLLHWCNLGQH